jgi:hypothetical protein
VTVAGTTSVDVFGDFAIHIDHRGAARDVNSSRDLVAENAYSIDSRGKIGQSSLAKCQDMSVGFALGKSSRQMRIRFPCKHRKFRL